jgi:hypothetical protein
MVPAELLRVTEDFQRLWEVTGFADALAARMARTPVLVSTDDPAGVVLGVHREMLVGALRSAREQKQVRSDLGCDELADALVGVYLSRRLAGRPSAGWARAATAAVVRH